MSQISETERKAIVERGYANPLWFIRFFFEEWFPRPAPWVHRGVIAILTKRCDFLLEFDEHYGEAELKKIIENFVWRENPEDELSPEHPVFILEETNGQRKISMVLGKYTLIMMPRGTSKTTLVNAINIWYIVYQECKFPVYVSETATHAHMQLTTIATQLTTNQRLLAIFGELKPPQRSGLTWSESDGHLQTTTGLNIMAKGRGSQIRGTNINAQRPDRLIFDDLEDKESVKTDDQRMKTREWFFGDAMPALPKLDPNATAVALATLLHSDALVVYLSRDKRWTTIKFGALDKDGEPIWPEWMDLKKLDDEKEAYASKGLLHVFYLEYYNQVRNPDKAKFKRENIIYDPVPLELIPFRAIAWDPAISTSRRADFRSMAVVGMRENGIIQVCEIWMSKSADPREQIDKFFELKLKWKTQKQGIESQAFQAALIHLVREEMFRKAKELKRPDAYFEITSITHSSQTKKEDRVEGILQPRYAGGWVRHQMRFPEFETQLLDWPNGKKDGPDVVAMAVSLLDPVAGYAGGDEEANDSMPPLEEVFGGDWRSY